ncbi:MAG TPA: hypothetical protein VN495_00800 [Candidatus Paceibacterota bacterium]|nr:hypothetical protein [Candidatus Paceibacterota bacterium]
MACAQGFGLLLLAGGLAFMWINWKNSAAGFVGSGVCAGAGILALVIPHWF